jgi:hypothetical protein
LQCIFATPFLNNYFIKDFKKSSSSRNQRLSQAYYDLIVKVKQGGELVITPTDLKYAVSKNAP